MTIQYQVVENSLREGEYFPRVVAGPTVPLDDTIKAIVRETGVSETDVKAVLNALQQRIVLALLDGRQILIDGLGLFSVSLSEKLPSADAEVSDAVEVRVNVRPDAGLLAAVRKEARFERVVRKERIPTITGFHDVATGESDRYTAGNIGELVGDDLQFDPGAADEGIFFIAADESEVRAATYAQVGRRKVLFLVPPGLSGEQQVEVRTRYGTQRMRVSRYRNPVLPA